MRKTIITVGIILALCVAGLLAATTFRPITFASDEDVDSLSVIADDGTAIREITMNTLEWFTPGEYHLRPNGAKIDQSTITITVERGFGGQTIAVEPGYSQSYLASLEPGVTSIISTELFSRYSDVMQSYDITGGTLHGEGEWYTALLYNKETTDNSSYDVYRVVAKKGDGDAWEIIHRPVLIATKSNFPDVPKDILNAVNTAVVNPSVYED